VFRVPRDHDGHGVVCPNCRRLLKIPLPGDRPAPLMVSLPTPGVEEAEQAAEEPHAGGDRRRKKRVRMTDDQLWDSTAESTQGSSMNEKRQMIWMLAGGGALFALILGFVLEAMLGGKKSDSASVASAVVPPIAQPAVLEKISDAAFLSAAEQLARKFLEAKGVDEMLPLVRNPDTAAPRMRAFYPDGSIKAVGMAEFNTNAFVIRMGSALYVRIRTVDSEDKFLAFFETADGLRIDWESWVAWSEMPWEAFMAAKPATAQVFRVKLSAVDYYNMDFADDAKWQSFFMESPDGSQTLYGYAEIGSTLSVNLKPPSDAERIQLTLSLRYPPNASSPNQVIIEKIISESWVEESTATP
jgi:hypothetical protein